MAVLIEVKQNVGTDKLSRCVSCGGLLTVYNGLTCHVFSNDARYCLTRYLSKRELRRRVNAGTIRGGVLDG